jgi:hypothetical protein
VQDALSQLYLAQMLFQLGEEGNPLNAALKVSPHLTWNTYRQSLFAQLAAHQGKDGSWGSMMQETAIPLLILQMDREHLPIFQRVNASDRALLGTGLWRKIQM